MQNELELKIKEEIKQHALEIFPIECCGLVLFSSGKRRVLKSKNLFNSSNKFLIDKDIFKKINNNETIEFVYHSHSHENHIDFSSQDLISSQKTNINFILYNTVLNTFKIYEP